MLAVPGRHCRRAMPQAQHAHQGLHTASLEAATKLTRDLDKQTFQKSALKMMSYKEGFGPEKGGD